MENSRLNHFVGIAMLLGLIVPHTSIFLMAINPVLAVLLFIFVGSNVNRGFGVTKFLISVVVLVSLISSALFLFHDSDKYILSSVFFMMLILLFPFVGRQRIPNIYYFIAIGIILFSQLVYLFNMPSIQRIIETLYPVSETDLNSFEYMTENINSGNIFGFRLGGIFRNANQSARYTSLITAAYLADRPNENMRKTGLLVLLALGSVLFTGSRTGLAVITLIILLFFLRNNSIKKSSKIILTAIVVAFVIPIFIGGSQIIRGFNINQGFNDSAIVKLDVFRNYLSQDNSFFHLLFGYCDTKTFQPSRFGIMSIFDSEYGDLIYSFGFLGFVLVISFYIKSVRICQKENRLFFVILLWSITSTVLMSYRMSFLFMLFLSHFVSLKQEKIIQPIKDSVFKR